MFSDADKWRVMNAEVTETQGSQRKTSKTLRPLCLCELCIKYSVFF